MRVLVPIKRVVDYAVKVRVNSNKTGIDLNNLKFSINPFCEIAIEEAIKLKEKNIVKEIILCTIGPKNANDILVRGMAMGGDRSIHITTDLRLDQELQPLAVASILKNIAEKEKVDFILMGKQAIDDDSNQTGQLTAGFLNWSQGTFISKLEIVDKTATIAREVDGGLQFLSMKLPSVFTCDLRLNEPRFPSLPNIMKAKKKPIELIDIKSLNIDITPRLKVLSVEEPIKRVGGIKVETVPELVNKLKGLGCL